MKLPQYFASNGKSRSTEAPPPAMVMPGYKEAPPDMVDMPEHSKAPPPMGFMPMQAPHPMMDLPDDAETSPLLMVTTEPSMNVMPPPTVYKDYLTWSILNMIFCSLLLGAVACSYSGKTRAAVHRQDLVAASSHSRSAFRWNVAATVVGTCITIGLIVHNVYYYNKKY